MSSYPRPTNTGPTSTIDALGDAATNVAAAAMFGHFGVTVAADYEAALAGTADYYLVHCGHPADKKGGRYWTLSLIRSSDIPALIDDAHAKAVEKAREKGWRVPDHDDTVVAFKEFHTGVAKKWLAWTVGAVVEIDHLAREEQERRYAALEAATGLRWTLKVFSGGKSVHAYLAFDRLLRPTAPLRLEIQHLLIAILEGDPAIVDPGRLTRLPGWDGAERKQPLLHLDDTARYSPEEIRDRLRRHAEGLGLRDLDRAVSALQIAKRLEDAACAPRDARHPHVVPADALNLVARLRATRFDPSLDDLDAGSAGSRVLRLAAQLHVASEAAGGEAALELREHADLLRARWQALGDDDLALARVMLGRSAGGSFGGSFGDASQGGWSSSGGTYFAGADVMEPFRALRRGDRVAPPCCGTGGSGRTDGAAQVMHRAGESPRLWCHRCGHLVAVEPAPIVHGFRYFGFGQPGCTTRSKKNEVSSATSRTFIRVNEKRLTDAIPDPLGLLGGAGGIIVVRSPQETGKTHLAGLIAAECHRRWSDEAQVAPTHRVALVRNLAGRLDYETYDVDAGAQCVATTLDSITRIPTYETRDGGMLADRRFSFMFLDEVAQLLRHAVGGTIGATAPAVLNKLRCIFSQARYILAADADADDNVVEILQMLAPSRKVVVVDNEWRPADRGAVLYDHRQAHLADFIEDVTAGMKVAYLTCGGPKHAGSIARIAEDARDGVRVKVYSRATSKIHGVQDELADINAAMKDCDVLIATPTLGSGVDIQDRGFDRVYLDVPAHEVGADEAVQLGFRVRHPKDRTWRVWVSPRNRRRETSPTRIRAELLDVRKQTEGVIAKRYKDSPVVKHLSATVMAPADGLHLDLYCRARAHVHAQTNDLRRAMRSRLEEAGFTVTDSGNADAATIKATGEVLKVAKESTTRERAERIVVAQDISTDEAERIDRARRATQEELDAAEKARIGDFYGTEPDAPLVIEDDWGRLRPKIALFAVYLLARDGEHTEALIRDVQRVRQGLTARIRGQYIAALLVKKVLALYGITGPVEHHQGRIKPVVDFEQRVRPLLPLLQRFLGITACPKRCRRNGQIVRLADIDPVRLLSRVLRKVGLRLEATPTKVAGKVVRHYSIDTALARHRMDLAQAAKSRMRQALVALEQEAQFGQPQVDDEVIDIDAILAASKIGTATAGEVQALLTG